jgi:hypothetical protein
MWDQANSTAIRQGLGYTGVYPGLGPQRVMTYVLLVWLYCNGVYNEVFIMAA